MNSYAQQIINDNQPVPDSLKVALRGVKYGLWSFTQDQVDYISNNPTDSEVKMNLSILDYLKKDIKLKEVALTPTQTEQLSNIINSLCEVVTIEFTNEGFKSDFLAVGKIKDMQLKFTFCDSTFYVIQTDMNVTGNTNYSKKPRKHFAKRLTIVEPYNEKFQRNR